MLTSAHGECTRAVAVAVLYLYNIRMGAGVCNLCLAFRNSSRPRCSVLELAFSKAKGRLSAT